ncbi:MAG: hypothetical protein OXE96_14055 [Gemmatimonadetes bacterium]|nr:hypothetical protein [Gemmatimonadota bacterium]
MHRNFAWSRPAMAALLIAASATTLSAQSTAQVPADEIDAIETRAMDNLKDLDRWDRAASLFRRAADLRPAGDPVAVQDLIQAARLSFYTGDEGRAVRDFEAAGQRAVAMGDVIVAANAFADAAWVANTRGFGARAHDLLNRAQLLATSPLIPEDVRDHLMTRWSATGPQQ